MRSRDTAGRQERGAGAVDSSRALYSVLLCILAVWSGCAKRSEPRDFIGLPQAELLASQGQPKQREEFPKNAKKVGQFLVYSDGRYEVQRDRVLSYQRDLSSESPEAEVSYWTKQRELGPYVRIPAQQGLSQVYFPDSGVRLILASPQGPVLRQIQERPIKHDL